MIARQLDVYPLNANVIKKLFFEDTNSVFDIALKLCIFVYCIRNELPKGTRSVLQRLKHGREAVKRQCVMEHEDS